jgi:hypothetical protein
MWDSDSRSQRTEITKAFAKAAEEGKALGAGTASRGRQSREMIAQSREVIAESAALLRTPQSEPAVKAYYRCYFLNGEDRIVTVEPLACSDDAEASRVAAKLLAERPRYPAAEVWDHDRKVSRHNRGNT